MQRVTEFLISPRRREHPAADQSCINTICLVHHAQGRLADARRMHTEALGTRRAALGDAHGEVAKWGSSPRRPRGQSCRAPLAAEGGEDRDLVKEERKELDDLDPRTRRNVQDHEEAAKRAEGTRRRPLLVRRGTRAGGELLGKEER